MLFMVIFLLLPLVFWLGFSVCCTAYKVAGARKRRTANISCLSNRPAKSVGGDVYHRLQVQFIEVWWIMPPSPVQADIGIASPPGGWGLPVHTSSGVRCSHAEKRIPSQVGRIHAHHCFSEACFILPPFQLVTLAKKVHVKGTI
jgi:hypothetical protein